MLIEFFGLPGTGKSTLSRLGADLLMNRGLIVDEMTYDLDHRRPRVQRQLAKLTHILRYVAAHPCRTVSDLARIAATRQATLLDLGKSSFNWIFIASLASQRLASSRITFLDQGVAQAVWSIGFAAQHGKPLDLLMADMEGRTLRPDLVVHVRADFQRLGDRLAGRERRVSRLDALGRDHQALLRAQAYGDAIIGKLKCAGIPVIEVENSHPQQLASTGQLITRTITTMLNEQAGGARLRHDRLPLAMPGDSPTDRSLADNHPIVRQYLSRLERNER
jgi:hypothetical protein